MLNKLIERCHEFYIKAMELDPELAEKVVLETGNELAEPTIEDQADIQILMKRAIKGLHQKNMDHFINSMIALDRLVRDFKHESFDEEFYDFVADQDLWDWIHSLRNKQMTNQDLTLLSIIKENLLYLISKPKLFK